MASHEGPTYAQFLQKHGINAFVLKYRLGDAGYRHPIMLGDAARDAGDDRRRRLDLAQLPRLGLRGRALRAARRGSVPLVPVAFVHLPSEATRPVDAYLSRLADVVHALVGGVRRDPRRAPLRRRR